MKFRSSLKSSIAAALAITMAFGAVGSAMVPVTAAAQDRHHDDRGRHDQGRHDDHRGDRHSPRPDWHGDRRWNGPPQHIVIQRYPDYYRPHYLPRVRYYENVRVYRPYGRAYPGFGFYYRDNDALRFLGLTALSLVVFNQLNEAQQRAHEEAFISATSAPIGEPIIWNEDGRSGSVTAVRDGVTADGRQCREFQQDVTIGGRRENAYGTACLQPDGSWEVVDNK